MATINPVCDYPAKGVLRAQWLNVTNADVCGELVGAVEYPQKTIDAAGVFNSAVVTVNGYNTAGGPGGGLHDQAGVLISVSAAGIRAIAENPWYIKPGLTGGTAGQALNLVIIGKANNP